MPDWELIVVENGSTDDGPEIVRQFLDPRIRLVVSPKGGPGAARNFGLSLVKGKWILFLDADDLLTPNYLEEQITAASHQPLAQIIAGCWQEFSANSQGAMELHHPTFYHEDPAGIVDSAIAYAPWALHAAMIKRDWLGDKIRWFEPLDGGPSEDTAFWFATIQKASIGWSDSQGALYRVNTHNSRNSSSDANRWLKGLKKVITTNLETLSQFDKKPTSRQRAIIMRTFESRYRQELFGGNIEGAMQFYEEATGWLRACSWCEGSIMLRKIIGISLLARLTRLMSICRF